MRLRPERKLRPDVPYARMGTAVRTWYLRNGDGLVPTKLAVRTEGTNCPRFVFQLRRPRGGTHHQEATISAKKAAYAMMNVIRLAS
jgi:hypothetical protein